METLRGQFETLVFKKELNEDEDSMDYVRPQDTNPKHEAADMRVAKDIRESISQVLGPDLSPAVHMPRGE